GLARVPGGQGAQQLPRVAVGQPGAVARRGPGAEVARTGEGAEMSDRRVAMSVTEGRTVRDLFANGVLELLGEAGVEVTVFTEAVMVPQFVAEWSRPNVRFEPFYPAESTPWR